MNRNEAREVAMKLIFQYEVQKSNFKEGMDLFLSEYPDNSQMEYVKEVYDKFLKNREEIDSLISENSKNWPIYRMPKADLAIIRLAICEILYLDSVPTSVAINEAVKLAHRYCDVKSYKFINGILGKISRDGEN